MGCLFCDIINGKIEGKNKIYEDKEFIAILDAYPNVNGQVLILTKKHYSSYVFNMNDKLYCRFLKFSKKVAKILDKKLKVKRTAMVMEGLGIDHAHIKLYPLHGLKKEFEEKWPKNGKLFKKYMGYVTTRPGPKISKKKIKDLLKKLKT